MVKVVVAVTVAALALTGWAYASAQGETYKLSARL